MLVGIRGVYVQTSRVLTMASNSCSFASDETSCRSIFQSSLVGSALLAFCSLFVFGSVIFGTTIDPVRGFVGTLVISQLNNLEDILPVQQVSRSYINTQAADVTDGALPKKVQAQYTIS